MATAQPLTEHDQIRRWAQARGARPACVKGTGGKGDTGMIRLDFPGYSGAESLQPISWPQWFRQFDENNLALLVQEKTASGQKSNFNKLVSRGTGRAGRSGARKQARAPRARKQPGAAGSRKRAGAARSLKQAGATRTRKQTAKGRSRKQATRTRSASSRGAGRGRTGARKTASKTARRRAS